MTTEKDSIPYGTYGRFKLTVDQFAENITPTVLDNHVLRTSGGDFSALMTTLKFLGLINNDQSVKPEFRALVELRKKDEAEYKAQLLKIINTAYAPTPVSKVDITHGTLPQLEKAFKDAGVPQGQMVTKAIRFYVKAIEDCGVQVSKYITEPRPRVRQPKPPKPPKPARDGSPTNGGGAAIEDRTPQGFERVSIPGLADAFVQYPTNITDSNCDLFEAIIGVLRTYAKSRKGSEGKKS